MFCHRLRRRSLASPPFTFAVGTLVFLILSTAPVWAQKAKVGHDRLDDLSVRSLELWVNPQIQALDLMRPELTADPNARSAAFLSDFDALQSLGRWSAEFDRLTGKAAILEGGGIPWIPGAGNSLTAEQLGLRAGTPASGIPARWVARRAFDLLATYPDLLGVKTSDLVLRPAASGPIGDTLYFLDFDWTYHGIPVENAHVIFRLNNGNLVQFGQENVSEAIESLSPEPALSVETAWQILWGYLDGRTPEDKILEQGRLLVVPVSSPEAQSGVRVEPGTGLSYRLVYVLAFKRQGVMGTWEARVDAHTGEILSFADANDYGHIQGGTYKTDKNPTQTEVVMPFAYADYMTSTYADGAGNYPGTSGTSTLKGKYVRISDTCGAINLVSDGSGLIDFGTSGGTDCTTPGVGGSGNTHASRTQYWNVTAIKLKGLSYLPSNTWLQGQLLDNVNLNQTCNAYWDGSAINFFKSGGGCGNTGELPGVSLHEWGHGMDSNDGNGSSPDKGTGETYGDFTAALQTHQSCIGGGFLGGNCGGYGVPCTSCTGVRDIDYAMHNPATPATPANFNLVHCSSALCTGPCNKECHCESAPSSQALWDLAARDLVTWGLDATTAWQVVDRLWYLSRSTAGSAFTCNANGEDGCGTSSYFRIFRVVDDCDGDLSNGTPHASAIFAAFNRHGIACSSVVNTDDDCGCATISAPALSGTPGNNLNNLSWTAAAGATSYDVFRNETSCDAGFTKIGNTVSTSFTDTAAANGVTYYYRLQANGTAGCPPSQMSNCVTLIPIPCTAPGVPSGLAASAPSANTAHLSWSAGSPAGATYNIYRGYGTCGAATLSLLATGVSALTYDDLTVSGGTTYAYEVTAVDATGGCESAHSGCAQVTATGACTRPPDFAGIASVTNPGSTLCALQLSWGSATAYCGGPVTFNVYRSTTSPFTPGPANLVATGLSSTSYTDNANLVSGTAYYYVVRAVDETNGSVDPNTVIMGGTPTGPIVVATWTDDAGDTGSAQMALNSPWTIAGTGGHAGPKVYQTGSYANNLCTSIVTPSLWLATNSQLTFWSKYDIETGWDKGLVEISTNGGSTWQRVPVNYPDTATHASDACGYPANTTYFSKTNSTPVYVSYTASLSAWNNQNVMLRWSLSTDSSVNGAGWWVDDISITNVNIPGTCTTTAGCTAPGAPTLLSATGTCSGVDLIWSAGTGVTSSYNVYRSGAPCGGPYSKINVSPVVGTTYTDSAVAGGANYAYVVRGACDAAGTSESPDSNCLTGGPLTPAAPGAPTFSDAGCSTLTVSWSAVPGATLYDLYRKEGGCGPGTLVAGNLAATTYNDSGLSSGTTYGYYLVAKNATCSSTPGSCASHATASLPGTPSGVSASSACSGVTVSWTGVAGATSYNVVRGLTCGVAGASFPGASSPFLDSTGDPGTPYFYWVEAVNACGAGPASACASGTRTPAPLAPTGFGATESCGGVLLNWNPVADATSYTVHRGTTCGVSLQSFSVGGTVFNDVSGDPGVAYNYWVTASNTCGTGPSSGCITATRTALPAAPTGVTASGSCEDVTLTWGDVPNALHYKVVRGASCGVPATTFDGVTSPFHDTTAVVDTPYTYWVVASNTCGDGPSSTCVQGTRPSTPAQPPQPSFSGVGCAGLTLSWPVVGGVTATDVYRSEGSCGTGTLIASDVAGTSYADSGLLPGHTYGYAIVSKGPCGTSPMGLCATVTTLAAPSITAQPAGQVIHTGQTATLSVTADGAAPLSYQWYTGASGDTTNPINLATGANLISSPLTSNAYFWVRVTNGCGHADSAAALVTVCSLTCAAQGSPSAGILPLAVSFGADAILSSPLCTGPATYDWDFGDGSAHSTEQNPSHTYTAEGSFTWTCIVSYEGMTCEKTGSITVWEPLAASIAADHLEGTVPFTVGFTSAAAGGDGSYSYAWSFGDGGIASSANPLHAYTSSGTFPVMLIVSDGAGHTATSNTLTIHAYDPLSVTLSGTPTSGVVPFSVAFTPTVDGGNGVYTYSYNYGDGISDASGHHTYTAAGSFAAILTVHDSASHTAVSAPVIITAYNPMAVTLSAAPASGIVPLTVGFSHVASGGDGHYLSPTYVYGDGSSGSSASHTYAAQGSYSATATVTDTSGHSGTSAPVTIVVLPVPPEVTLVKKMGNPFRIKITGGNLQQGLQVFVDGQLWTNVKWKNTGLIKLKGGGTLKALFPKGVFVPIRIVNPDGGEVTVYFDRGANQWRTTP